jgi:hypothetical protein
MRPSGMLVIASPGGMRRHRCARAPRSHAVREESRCVTHGMYWLESRPACAHRAGVCRSAQPH